MKKKTDKKRVQAVKRSGAFSLTLEAKEGSLGRIRKFIENRMKSTGFPQKKISALKVSVTEHCENLIRHAYAGKRGKVELKLLLKYPEAKITALDSGPRFNMERQKIPDTARRFKKGLGGKMGIKTIMALCDSVEYKRIRGRNANTFIVLAGKSGRGKQ